ncbi:hypothetical protein SAMD00019534_115280 [Acytostelium subglobosum LB1]|uniref:hypothetical protein n=1 Tax=Acytostelium subglobosum LB1 TaxID=1410327 RepID=UPI000644C095|nr:hypothetical protein SAMD00019534_115280 [Acytostelium subglobosum LB1]GAM28352.1 hypothetical protein SAMD00019534_115280 [Acytostelium subglobosum LB1]|eukprot:XP_012748669.1 hypothetical protein SAMD00019534_115280 [Acytostelium subglobosum LB1]
MSTTTIPNEESFSLFIQTVQHCCAELNKPDLVPASRLDRAPSPKAYYLRVLHHTPDKFANESVPAEAIAKIESARSQAKKEVVINNAFFDSVDMNKVPGQCACCHKPFGQRPRQNGLYDGDNWRFRARHYDAALEKALERHLINMEVAKEMAKRQQLKAKVVKFKVDDDNGGPSNVAQISKVKPVESEDEEEPPAKPAKIAKAKVVEEPEEEPPAKPSKAKHQAPLLSPPAKGKGKGKK